MSCRAISIALFAALSGSGFHVPALAAQPPDALTQLGTNTTAANGFLPFPPAPNATTRNNLNNRLIQLAANIKAQGIKIYVVKFAISNTTVASLLQTVASSPGAPYYYVADDAAELREAFQLIGADLSKLRLSK